MKIPGFVFLLLMFSINLYSSPKMDNNILTIVSKGVAYLGSGITEEQARKIALNDAKLNALERCGTYLESHTTILNHQLASEEITTFTGGLVNIVILNEERTMINNMFAYNVEIKAMVDIDVLNKRIDEVSQDRDLWRRLEAEKQRNRKMQHEINKIKMDGNYNNSNIQFLLNLLSAKDWYDKAESAYDNYVKIDFYSQAIDLDPTYFYALNNRGILYQQEGKLSLALRDFDAAIQHNSENASIYNNRGAVYSELGQLDNALMDFNKAIALDPRYIEALYNRALLYIKTSDFYSAKNDLDKCLEERPYDREILFSLGLVFYRMQEYNHAIQMFDRALQTDQLYTECYYYKALSYDSMQEYNRAMNMYTKVITLDPNFVDAYINGGVSLVNLKKEDQAISFFNKAMQYEPENPIVHYNMGIAYMSKKDYENAGGCFTKALMYDPDLYQAYKKRALVNANLENHSNAITDFKKYLLYIPANSPEYNQIIDWIHSIHTSNP